MEKDMKKDVKDIIQKEEIYLNNLLTQEDLSAFKGMVDEYEIHGPRNKCFEQKQKQCFLYYKIIDTLLKLQSIGNVLENNHHT